MTCMGRMAVLISALAVVFLPFAAYAHSFGSFYEETVGPYLVDIGYDPPAPPGGSRLLFDFSLYADSERTASVEFSSIWVRLEHNGELLLAGPIGRMLLGPTTLVVRMPQEEGELTVHARFEQESNVLAEVSFPITIAEPPQESIDWRVWALAGLGAFALAGYFYRRRFR